MIKIRYVGLVEVECMVPETPTTIPVEQVMKKMINGAFTDELKECIQEDFFGDRYEGSVKICQQFADAYRVEEKND